MNQERIDQLNIIINLGEFDIYDENDMNVPLTITDIDYIINETYAKYPSTNENNNKLTYPFLFGKLMSIIEDINVFNYLFDKLLIICPYAINAPNNMTDNYDIFIRYYKYKLHNGEYDIISKDLFDLINYSDNEPIFNKILQIMIKYDLKYNYNANYIHLYDIMLHMKKDVLFIIFQTFYKLSCWNIILNDIQKMLSNFSDRDFLYISKERVEYIKEILKEVYQLNVKNANE